MEEVVLDSSVIVKAILKPGRWLLKGAYGMDTHIKVETLIRLLDNR